MAFQPEEERRRLLNTIELAPLTPHTITDPAELAEELERVRQQGYAIDDQELALELRCVAAPVLADDGSLISAVSISAPADKLLRESIPDLLPGLREAVSTISANMAEVPPRAEPSC